MKSQINVEEFEKVYYAGVAPSDIAKKMGVRYSVLGTWMSNHHYAAICPAQQKIAMALYTSGATDLEIATAIGRQISTVVGWREKNKLKKMSGRRKVIQ